MGVFVLYQNGTYTSVYKRVGVGALESFDFNSDQMNFNKVTIGSGESATDYYWASNNDCVLRNVVGYEGPALVTTDDHLIASTKYFPVMSHIDITADRDATTVSLGLGDVTIQGIVFTTWNWSTGQVDKKHRICIFEADITPTSGNYAGITIPCYVFMFLSEDQQVTIDSVLSVSGNSLAISKNAFDKAKPERGEAAEEDDESGYPDEDRGDGEIDSSLPDYNAIPTGGSGLHQYRISSATYDQISAELWGQDEGIFSSLWKKFTNYKFNPIAGIINCIRLPDKLMPSYSGETNIRMAGVALSARGYLINSQWKLLSYTVPIQCRWGMFRDYDASTRVILHIPYCGIVSLSPSVCGRVLTVNYKCDCFTGNVLAVIGISDFLVANAPQGKGAGGGTIAIASGNCGYGVPICGNDNGMGHILAASKHYVTGMFDAAGSAISLGQRMVVQGETMNSVSETYGMNAASSIGAGISKNAAGTVMDILTAPHTTSLVGGIGGGSAILSDPTFWYEIETVVDQMPANYYFIKGIPNQTGITVGGVNPNLDNTVFAKFSGISLGAYSATDSEKREIEALLMSGIWI